MAEGAFKTAIGVTILATSPAMGGISYASAMGATGVTSILRGSMDISDAQNMSPEKILLIQEMVNDSAAYLQDQDQEPSVILQSIFQRARESIDSAAEMTNGELAQALLMGLKDFN